ncbi:MAG: hypothetical protein OES10_10915, partial [Gammaproteobacteria bacterium]|nr:hypothetical protein [Gammaproteobacteria bacterium]
GSSTEPRSGDRRTQCAQRASKASPLIRAFGAHPPGDLAALVVQSAAPISLPLATTRAPIPRNHSGKLVHLPTRLIRADVADFVFNPHGILIPYIKSIRATY